MAVILKIVLSHPDEFGQTLKDPLADIFIDEFLLLIQNPGAEDGISGKELITALVLGVDISCRLGLSLRLYKGWHITAIAGFLGATVAVSKILGLKAEKMVHALGIAYSQTSGNMQTILDGGLTKRMQPAFAAKSAVLSGYLAARGVTGTHEVLDGRHGFF